MLFSTIITACLATFVAASPVPQTLSQLGNQAAGTAAASLAQTAQAAAAGFNASKLCPLRYSIRLLTKLSAGHPGVGALASTIAQSAASSAVADQAAAGLPIAGAKPSTQTNAAGTAAAIGTAVNALGLNAPVNAAAGAVANAIQDSKSSSSSSMAGMAGMGMY